MCSVFSECNFWSWVGPEYTGLSMNIRDCSLFADEPVVLVTPGIVSSPLNCQGNTGSTYESENL